MNIEIEGQKIVKVRPLTKNERNDEGWNYDDHVMCMILENGVKLYPSKDYEGNGGGALFGKKGKDTFAI